MDFEQWVSCDDSFWQWWNKFVATGAFIGSQGAVEIACARAYAAGRAQQRKVDAQLVEDMSPTYMIGMERWLKASECSDGQAHRLLDIAPHLEREAIAKLTLEGRKNENTYERIAAAILQEQG